MRFSHVFSLSLLLGLTSATFAAEKTATPLLVYIENRGSAGVLGVVGTSPEKIADNLAPIRQSQRQDLATQQWLLKPQGDGYFFIENRATGKLLQPHGYTTDQDGCDVFQYEMNKESSQHQLFKITPLENGFYRIDCKVGGKTLDLDASRLHDPGANLKLWSWNGGTHQQWILRPVK